LGGGTELSPQRTGLKHGGGLSQRVRKPKLQENEVVGWGSGSEGTGGRLYSADGSWKGCAEGKRQGRTGLGRNWSNAEIFSGEQVRQQDTRGQRLMSELKKFCSQE